MKTGTDPIRTERRFGVTAQLDVNALRRLYTIRASDVWRDVLDVMEQCCIEIESVLINTDAADEKSVLANHKMSKAAWQVFTHFQERIDSEISIYLSSLMPTPDLPARPYEDLQREYLLNPMLTEPMDNMGQTDKEISNDEFSMAE
jgi:hypothetical protein